jgi:hypothetical protein
MFAESLAQDVRYACRGARRSPLFAVSVAGTIGIGLGIVFLVYRRQRLSLQVGPPAAADRADGLTWDSAAHERNKLTLAEFEALAADNRCLRRSPPAPRSWRRCRTASRWPDIS